MADTSKIVSLVKAIFGKDISDLKTDITKVSVFPESFGAKGDGTTDDSDAVQDAIDSGFNVRFDDNKTYYLASPVTIDHDCHIYGGKNTTIKTKTPTGGVVNDAFVVSGTLKKETTLTTDYYSTRGTDNCSNKFTLSDMTGINIGDLLIIEATDQFYSYARQYYYLGGVLRVSDVYGGHIYTDISLPFDIENTENVTVKIYEAPTAIFENIKFVSDRESRGNYKFFVTLNYAKDCIVRNCDMTDMDNGLRIYMCHNTLVDNVRLSQSKYDNSLAGDGYGIMLSSSTNTVVQRITAICSQGCLVLGGTIPVLNTFVYNCNFNSECRGIGIDMHENNFNIVIEDCTLGGLSLYGTATVNRCRIVRNERIGANDYYITVRGSHDPRWADFKIMNCVFEGTGLNISKPVPQTPIQAFDNIIGRIEVINCKGGNIAFNPTTSEIVTSNTINRFIIKNWIDCKELYYTTGNIIKFLQIEDSTFTERNFINKHTGIMYMDAIYDFDYKSTNPLAHKIHVSKPTRGCNYVLPKDVNIQLVSNNPSSAKYVICGLNTTPNTADDYLVGSFTGAVGNSPTRKIATALNAPTVSIDGNGGVVYSQNNGTGNYSLLTVGMLYVKEASKFSIKATLKNTGNTDGASFYPYIAIVDCETGKLLYRGNGTKRTATAQGIEISHSYDVDKNCLVIGYFYCVTAVSGSESTFDDMEIKLEPFFIPHIVNEAYTAKRMTGDGTIQSLKGVNNIMSYESTFNVKINADLLS